MKIKPGFGQLVYNLMTAHRRPDLNAWTTADLAAAVTEEFRQICERAGEEVGDRKVDDGTVREWLNGKKPGIYVESLARVLGISTDDLFTAHRREDISDISPAWGPLKVPTDSYDPQATTEALRLISRIRMDPPVGADVAQPQEVRTIEELADTGREATEGPAQVHKRPNG